MRKFKLFFVFLTFLVATLVFAPHVRATSLHATSPMTFVSDTSWAVYNNDPALGSATLLGSSQFVCLSASVPSNCPPGATIYGHTGGGWTADLSSIPDAHWIWAPGINGTTSPAEFHQFYFSKTFQLASKTFGLVSISADDLAEVRVNGHIVGTIGSISDFSTASLAQSALTTFDLSPFLIVGSNVITIRGEDGPFGLCCPSNYAGNPAGVVFGGFFRSPSVQISPTQGPVGTKVVVQGSGFMSDQIEVTFENALVGVITGTNGTFTFTFNVPVAQPGLQHVEALDLLTGVSAVANFTVTPINTLSISVDVGTLYFPGETASVYTLATLSGTPLDSTTLQLQLTLTKPDGSVITLNNTFVGAGMFKSTYKIPTSGSIGTYALFAKAHVENAEDMSALAAFEVKPTWLSSQGPALATTGAALTGLVAVAAVLWRKASSRTRMSDRAPPSWY